MYYSDDIIEEVRMKNDIVDVISGYVKLQRKGSSYFGLCPFHNEEFSKEARASADLKSRLLEIQKRAASFYYYQLWQESGRQGLDYLKNRQLSDETIKKFGLG